MKAAAPNLKELGRAFEGAKNDYAAARETRFERRRKGLGGTADAHYVSPTDFYNLREKARDMDRNDAVIGALLDRAADNVVNRGFTLEPQTGDSGLDAELWARFDEWASDPLQCDAAGKFDFGAQQWHVCRQTNLDGDILGNPLEEGALQLLEADRCGSPLNYRNTIHGVELNAYGRAIAYWFSKKAPQPYERFQTPTNLERYPAFDDEGFRSILHVFNPRRVSQTRGVTALHPIAGVAGMFEDLSFAKLVQAQVVSIVGAFLERSADIQLGSRDTQTAADGTTETLESLSPGLVIRGQPGEKLNAFSPNVPNPEFFPHVKMLLQLIGLSVGIPFVVMLMDASETNFSGWRGAVEEAKKGWRRQQKAVDAMFCRPVYTWKVRQWLALPASQGGLGAAARNNKNIFAHKWCKPEWPYVNPKDDAEADAARITNLLASPRSVRGERGGDWEDLVAETVADNGLAIRTAIQEAQAISKETGETVSWKEVLFLIAQGKPITGRPADTDQPDKAKAPAPAKALAGAAA